VNRPDRTGVKLRAKRNSGKHWGTSPGRAAPATTAAFTLRATNPPAFTASPPPARRGAPSPSRASPATPDTTGGPNGSGSVCAGGGAWGTLGRV
jgi:hypothetical protein